MNQPTGLGTIRNLDYVMLLCTEIEPMRDFYADVLGFPICREIPGKFVELRVGGSLLALRLRGRPYDGSPSVPTSASVQLAFRVPPSDVDVAASQLADVGIELLEPVADLPDFGHRVLFFADPEHNVIEVYAEI
ncbi:MAG: glyoxalase/bleomycin resistance/dioxygenase family protein [Actinomycetia bacterium]|nr:glyoxalase/bleomycin resistance/dioxygenase family protein [Actinomycetes bacterium]